MTPEDRIDIDAEGNRTFHPGEIKPPTIKLVPRLGFVERLRNSMFTGVMASCLSVVTAVVVGVIYVIKSAVQAITEFVTQRVAIQQWAVSFAVVAVICIVIASIVGFLVPTIRKQK